MIIQIISSAHNRVKVQNENGILNRAEADCTVGKMVRIN
jgi:hypothetical protein